jgi:hypothetical protein
VKTGKPHPQHGDYRLPDLIAREIRNPKPQIRNKSEIQNGNYRNLTDGERVILF